MRALLSLPIYLVFCAAALTVNAEPLAAPLPDAQSQNVSNEVQGPDVFLNTVLVLDQSGVPSGWMLAPLKSGVSSCQAAESVNCLTSADLISRLDPPPAVSHDDPLRNNLPEPATWIMLAGGVPLLWARVRSVR